MIKQASIRQVREQKIPRANSRIVIAMCYYPRGLKKEWRDDYHSELAPDRTLFAEWKEIEKREGHDAAFVLTDYENRFTLSPLALMYLKIYSEESLEKDVYFVCQCEMGERCHREMLLLLAQKKFAAEIDPLFNDYSVFAARIGEFNVAKTINALSGRRTARD